MSNKYRRIGSIKSVVDFRAYLSSLNLTLPVEDGVLSAAEGSPLARSITIAGFNVGNRWAIHPMEGWDGTADGRPTAPTFRRWEHFGQSGAKLIWGGEAFAVRRDGRANPHQLYHCAENVSALRELHQTLV